MKHYYTSLLTSEINSPLSPLSGVHPLRCSIVMDGLALEGPNNLSCYLLELHSKHCFKYVLCYSCKFNVVGSSRIVLAFKSFAFQKLCFKKSLTHFIALIGLSLKAQPYWSRFLRIWKFFALNKNKPYYFKIYEISVTN